MELLGEYTARRTAQIILVILGILSILGSFASSHNATQNNSGLYYIGYFLGSIIGIIISVFVLTAVYDFIRYKVLKDNKRKATKATFLGFGIFIILLVFFAIASLFILDLFFVIIAFIIYLAIVVDMRNSDKKLQRIKKK
jgi:MFS family permease